MINDRAGDHRPRHLTHVAASIERADDDLDPPAAIVRAQQRWAAYELDLKPVADGVWIGQCPTHRTEATVQVEEEVWFDGPVTIGPCPAGCLPEEIARILGLTEYAVAPEKWRRIKARTDMRKFGGPDGANQYLRVVAALFDHGLDGRRSDVGGVRGDGRYQCPACGAKSDGHGLRVSQGRIQPVVLNCSAGCTPDDVLAALGLTWEDVARPAPEVTVLPQVTALDTGDLGRDERPGESGNGHHKVPDVEFWDARPELANIRQFAHSRLVQPWALLGNVLARVVCAVRPRFQLPATIVAEASLNLLVALVSPSGGGKSGAISAARGYLTGVEALPEITPGSGEGLAATFVAWDRTAKAVVQHTVSALFVATEVETLTALGSRSGATLNPDIRKVYSGEQLGHGYRAQEKRLPVPAHGYRACMVVGVQPAKSGPLLDEADAGGPQRYLWLPTTDPGIRGRVRPAEPPPLRWINPARDSRYDDALPIIGQPVELIEVCGTAQNVIVEAHIARQCGDGRALDGHALLTRLKVAAALGLLSGRVSVNDEDWQLAGHVMQVSDQARQICIDAVAAKHATANRARAHDDAERAVVVEEHIEEARLRRIVVKLVEKLRVHGDWMLRKQLRDSLASTDRALFEEAVGRAIKAGQVEAEDVTYRGQSSQRYRVAP